MSSRAIARILALAQTCQGRLVHLFRHAIPEIEARLGGHMQFVVWVNIPTSSSRSPSTVLSYVSWKRALIHKVLSQLRQ